MGTYYADLVGSPKAAVKLFTKKQLESLLRKFWRGEFKEDEIPEDLFNATLDKLEIAIAKVEYTDRDEDLIKELQNNVAVFSAFKSYRQSGELLAAIVDESGNKRSFAEYLKEARKIDAEYNQNWLDAEYNIAIRQARSAVQWKDFEEAADVYPNLEYMSSRSAEPRDAHKALYGIIKPINDPFWSTALPPNGWGCKCWVKQTRSEATPGKVERPEPIKGISGNAGQSGEVFSKDHPYMDISKEEKKTVQKEYLRLVKKRSNTD